jgi:predicted nuclease of predicted toxin-antitoxin system
MLRLAADENFNNDIVCGIIRRNSIIDIIRVQDAGLSGADDPTVLEWAAQTQRVLLTHDVETITYYAYERVRTGQPMPGVFESDDLYRRLVEQRLRIGAQDLKIAAITLAHDAILVTSNRRHFDQVPGPQIEDWNV